MMGVRAREGSAGNNSLDLQDELSPRKGMTAIRLGLSGVSLGVRYGVRLKCPAQQKSVDSTMSCE